MPGASTRQSWISATCHRAPHECSARRCWSMLSMLHPRRTAGVKGRLFGQYVAASVGADERCSACAGRAAGRVLGHALKRGVEAGPSVVCLGIATPDPLVDADVGERGLPCGRQRASCLQYQPPSSGCPQAWPSPQDCGLGLER
jgi:hypothetical protein